jgi:hypothetical protein
MNNATAFNREGVYDRSVVKIFFYRMTLFCLFDSEGPR